MYDDLPVELILLMSVGELPGQFPCHDHSRKEACVVSCLATVCSQLMLVTVAPGRAKVFLPSFRKVQPIG